MNKNNIRSRFSEILLRWYKKEKRKLPFRQTKEPYKVWLSEIILQQTQMNTGIKYYEKFIKRFPDIVSLANSPQEEVYSLWQGLGYYNRAKNLHKTAKIISDKGGVFPNSYVGLIELPGIGKYTAAAISSICFNEKNYVVDANVYRVLSRVFGIKTDITQTKAYGEFLNLTSSLAKTAENSGDYNEAIMDYGGSVCLVKKPRCTRCVFKDNCVAKKKNLIAFFPVKAHKNKIKKRSFNYLVFESYDSLLIKKRNKKDIWENLYEFYLLEGKKANKTIDKLKKSLGISLLKTIKIKNKAILSHQKIDVVFNRIIIEKKSKIININKKLKMKMIKKTEIKKFGFPKVIDNYLKSHS